MGKNKDAFDLDSILAKLPDNQRAKVCQTIDGYVRYLKGIQAQSSLTIIASIEGKLFFFPEATVVLKEYFKKGCSHQQVSTMEPPSIGKRTLVAENSPMNLEQHFLLFNDSLAAIQKEYETDAKTFKVSDAKKKEDEKAAQNAQKTAENSKLQADADEQKKNVSHEKKVVYDEALKIICKHMATYQRTHANCTQLEGNFVLIC